MQKINLPALLPSNLFPTCTMSTDLFERDPQDVYAEAEKAEKHSKHFSDNPLIQDVLKKSLTLNERLADLHKLLCMQSRGETYSILQKLEILAADISPERLEENTLDSKKEILGVLHSIRSTIISFILLSERRNTIARLPESEASMWYMFTQKPRVRLYRDINHVPNADLGQLGIEYNMGIQQKWIEDDRKTLWNDSRIRIMTYDINAALHLLHEKIDSVQKEVEVLRKIDALANNQSSTPKS